MKAKEEECVMSRTASGNQTHALLIWANSKTAELLPLRLVSLMLQVPIPVAFIATGLIFPYYEQDPKRTE